MFGNHTPYEVATAADTIRRIGTQFYSDRQTQKAVIV